MSLMKIPGCVNSFWIQGYLSFKVLNNLFNTFSEFSVYVCVLISFLGLLLVHSHYQEKAN